VDSKPATGFLTVNVTINAENPTVDVTVYRGNFEDNDVVDSEMVSQAEYSFELPVDETYSATASYVSGANMCLTLEQAQITMSSERFRDAVCWTVVDASVDLRFSGSCPR
jgi:hypothetical protein